MLLGEDYCISDEFEASCESDEVIVMASALYGRMALGRCVEEDGGHLGCSNSALEAMDELCSGKRSCEFDVVKETKRLWENTQHSCPRALMGYLDAEYTCRQGELV